MFFLTSLGPIRSVQSSFRRGRGRMPRTRPPADHWLHLVNRKHTRFYCSYRNKNRECWLVTCGSQIFWRPLAGTDGSAEFIPQQRSVVNDPVWCLRNGYTFVALKLAWGEARGRECILSDTRPTEQRSPRPISAQPEGRPGFWAEASLLAPHRSTAEYARRSRLASGLLTPRLGLGGAWK
jgi:hypothetical protein